MPIVTARVVCGEIRSVVPSSRTQAYRYLSPDDLVIDATNSRHWKDRGSDTWRIVRLPGVEFLRRFLQHVLPRGFHRCRYYGLWHASKR
ncbi:MAG: transposase, partial [Pirellulaceae bacterium]|nr:transposase [Pirellulaceae bacterium]